MENPVPAKARSHQIVAMTLLGGLLFLRLPFLAGIAFFTKPDWLDPVFQIGTYLLTACLIWWERDRLADFHIDRLALAIIILFKPIQTIYLYIWKIDFPLAFPNWPSLIVWMIAIGLLLALWLSHPRPAKFSKASFAWFGIGILVGVGGVLLLAYPDSLQIDKPPFSARPDVLNILLVALPNFFYQLGYAAVAEEPLFRGFLWGYLQKAGWKNVWIWLFQAGLFVLGHIYYVNTLPISFCVIVPVGTLIFGAIVWRSKTISSSLAAHATMNALLYAAGLIIALSR
jgi:membrane protease YdiL (CAAX protease family)